MKHKQNYKVFQLNNAKHESTRNPQKTNKSEQQKYCSKKKLQMKRISKIIKKTHIHKKIIKLYFSTFIKCFKISKKIIIRKISR